MEYDAHQRLIKIRILLSGFIKTNKKGLPQKEYVSGEEEDELRGIFANFLRSREPVPDDIRKQLADLIEGTPSPESRSSRKLVFVRRRRGAEPQVLANSAIAVHVWNAILSGHSVSAAIIQTVEKFDLDESTVKKIWLHLRPIFREIEKTKLGKGERKA